MQICLIFQGSVLKEISWNKKENLTKQFLEVTSTVLQNIQFPHGYVLLLEDWSLFYSINIYIHTLINLHYRAYAHVVLTHQASYKHTVTSVRSCGRTEQILSVHRKITKWHAFVAYNKENFELRDKLSPFDFRVVGPLYCGSESGLQSRRVQYEAGLMGFDGLDSYQALMHCLIVSCEMRYSGFQLSRNILFARHVAAHSLRLPEHVNAWGEMDGSNFRSLSCHFIMGKQIGSIRGTCYCRECSLCIIWLQLKLIKSPLWLLISQDSICIRFHVCISLEAAFKATYSRQESSCWLLPC